MGGGDIGVKLRSWYDQNHDKTTTKPRQIAATIEWNDSMESRSIRDAEVEVVRQRWMKLYRAFGALPAADPVEEPSRLGSIKKKTPKIVAKKKIAKKKAAGSARKKKTSD